MKYTKYDKHVTGMPVRSLGSPTRPPVKVNNFGIQSPDQLYRSKSVLFSRSSVGQLPSVGLDWKQRDDDIELLTSPRSDVSRSSRISSKKPTGCAGDGPDSIRGRRQSRTLSVSSDMTDTALPVKTAWEVFEEGIKSIDDTTEYFSRSPKPSFKSSDVFQKVMVDLYGNPEYGQIIGYTKLKGKVGNISAMTSRMVARRRTKKDEASKAEQDELDLAANPPPSKTTIDNARRGWTILRRHVQEQITQNKCKTSNLQWTMLGQTLRAMSNTEKTRMDLYQRYGLVPKLNSDGHFVQENSMLSERARSLMKPTTNQTEVYKPPKSQIRARSSNLPRGSSVNTSVHKQRPIYSRQRILSSGPKPS